LEEDRYTFGQKIVAATSVTAGAGLRYRKRCCPSARLRVEGLV